MMKVRTLMMNKKTIAGFMLAGFVAVSLSILSTVSQAESEGRTMSNIMEEMMGNRNGMGSGMGMMGGQGMMGMMGGMGMDMMGGGGMMDSMGTTPFPMLDLTEQQRTRINKIQRSLRKKNWSTMDKIMDEKDRLRDLNAMEKRNPRKIGAVYGRIFNFKRQMIETTITANNQKEAVLTKEQYKQLKQSRRGKYKDAGSRGHGRRSDMPGGMMGR